MKAVFRLFRRVGRGGQYAALLALRSPYEALSTLVNALWLQGVFASVLAGRLSGLWQALGWMSLGVALLYLYNGSVWTLYSAFLIRWMGRLRAMLFGRVARLTLREIDAKPAGEWFSRLNADAKLVQALISEPNHLPFLAVSVVGLIASCALLGAQSAGMLAVVLAFVAPHVLLSQVLVARPMKRLNANLQRLSAENAAELHTLVECAAPARLNQAEDWLLSRFAQGSLAICRVGMKVHLRSAAARSLFLLMGLGGFLAALLAGGAWIARGQFDFAALVAMLQYRGGIILSAMMLLNSLITIRGALAGTDRILETLGEEPAPGTPEGGQ